MHGCEQLIDKLRRSTVQVRNGGGGGSGVVWSAGGLVVTNAHVAAGRHAEIIDAWGRQVTARIVQRDPKRDLALLEAPASGLEPVEIGDPGSLRSGQIVVAIGHPLGIAGAVAVGMIHAVGPLGFGARQNWIQADVRLAPGNSGGILADAAGRVIGINTMIFHGIGLAIPADEVNRFVFGQARNARAA